MSAHSYHYSILTALGRTKEAAAVESVARKHAAAISEGRGVSLLEFFLHMTLLCFSESDTRYFCVLL